MFELPETINLARQMNTVLPGRTIRSGQLGNSPHKFVWYNRSPEEFAAMAQGKRVGKAWARGRWLFIPLDPGYLLLFGEIGGKLLYHQPGANRPKKFHLFLTFDDDSFLTATTQMWGAYELYEKGMEQEREYVKDMAVTPVEDGFTFAYFSELIDSLAAQKKTSAKSLLTQNQVIPGLGNAVAQDILFQARLSPKHLLRDLNQDQRLLLYQSIIDTVEAVTEQGGRCDEFDLFGNPGGYVRIMDKEALKRPCPRCGSEVKKIQYLGGACYFCPSCQQ